MDLLLKGEFRDPELIYWAGWWSALVCFGMASTTAMRVHNQSQLFMAAMLFAATWVLLAGAAAGRLDAVTRARETMDVVRPSTSEIIVADRAIDVGGFLLVFVGAMLAREKPERHWAQKLHWLFLVGALVFMILLVRPSELMNWVFKENDLKRDLALGEVVGAIGFLTLTVGVVAVGARWHKFAIVVTMFMYEVASLYRLSQLWDVPKEAARPTISAELGYSFVTLRLIATFIVTSAILKAYRDWKDLVSPLPDRAIDRALSAQSDSRRSAA